MFGARIVLVYGLIAAALLLATHVPVRGDDDELRRKLDALAQQVEKLERGLGISADATKRPIADRVETLEKGLGELSRSAGKPSWSSPDSNLRELRRALESGERQRNDLSTRLSQLERNTRDVSDVARELRSMRTTLDGMRTDLRDLETRVRRLESRP